MKLIKLTEWRSENTVFVDPDKIVSMRRISASVKYHDGNPEEFSERTRIDLNRDRILVVETPELIMALTE